MATHGDLSPAARERAHRTVLVADVFGEHAETIVAALRDVPAGHVLVAVVDGKHRFAGTHQVDRAELARRVPELEDGGAWAMVFSPGATADEIRHRTDEMATLAAQRAATIDRILARRDPGRPG